MTLPHCDVGAVDWSRFTGLPCFLLKAYLRAHNINNVRRWGHEIGELYIECRKLGLTISSDDQFGLGNIVSLLERGNEDMAFRYFTLKSGSEPDLRWTREVVGQLMQAVAAFVQPKGPAAPGRCAKLTIIFGKPVSQEPAISLIPLARTDEQHRTH